MEKCLYALLISQCFLSQEPAQALQKVQTIPLVQSVSSEMVNESLISRLKFTCTSEQRIAFWCIVGVTGLGIVTYYRKSCKARLLNCFDWARRVHVTQMERDEQFYRAMAEGRLLGWLADNAETLWYRGADVNGVVHGKSPLHIVSANGNEREAQWLLAHQADKNKKDNAGMTPVMHAVMSREPATQALVYLFNQKGADFTIVDNSGESVLHKAVRNPTVLTERFIENLVTPETIDLPDKSTETPLLKLIVYHDPSPGIPDYTNLITRIANQLIDSQADTHLKDAEGKTALHRAIRHKYPNLVRRLLTCCNTADLAEIDQAIQDAITYQRYEMIDSLVHEAVPLYSVGRMMSPDEIKAYYEWMLLVWSLKTKQLAIVRQIISLRKTPQAILENFLWTVLHPAQNAAPAEMVTAGLVSCLIENGANVLGIRGGDTLLIQSVKRGKAFNPITRVILDAILQDIKIQHGEDIYLEPHTSGSRIHSARISDIINHKDADELDALAHAGTTANPEMVNLLMRYRSNSIVSPESGAPRTLSSLVSEVSPETTASSPSVLRSVVGTGIAVGGLALAAAKYAHVVAQVRAKFANG